jgi:hypothetical protein
VGEGGANLGDATYATPSDLASACTMDGPDIFYSFSLSELSDVIISVNRTGEASAFSLRKSCIDDAAEEIGCQSLSEGSTKEFVKLPMGQYILRIGAVGAASERVARQFLFTITASTASTDPCSSPAELIFDRDGHASASGDTTSTADSAMGDCGGAGSGDQVWKLTVPDGPHRMITATVNPTGSGSTFTPMVYLRTGCADGESELVCGLQRQMGLEASAIVPDAAPGDYYLWIDGSFMTTGPFDLSVQMNALPAAPLNDTCDGAIDITSAIGPTFGTTLGAAADYNFQEVASCKFNDPVNSSGADAVYTFSASATGSYQVDVVPLTSSFVPTIYVTSGACGTTCEAYVSQSAATIEVATAPTTYSIIVSSTFNENQHYSPGDFTIQVQMPKLCEDAIAITKGDSVAGSTQSTTNNYGTKLSSACAGASFLGNDVVYAFTMTPPGPAVPGFVPPPIPIPFTVVVTPSSSYDVVVWSSISSGSCDNGCTMAVDAQGPGATETLSGVASVGTTVFIVVDGKTADDKGDFSIQITTK